MLAKPCCSEADTGRSFHLYMALCEQYRVPKVEWYCDQELGIVYMVTGGVEAVTPPPEHNTNLRHCPPSPAETSTSGDQVELEATPDTETSSSPAASFGDVVKLEATPDTKTSSSPVEALGDVVKLEATPNTETSSSPVEALGDVKLEATPNTKTSSSPVEALGDVKLEASPDTKTSSSPAVILDVVKQEETSPDTEDTSESTKETSSDCDCELVSDSPDMFPILDSEDKMDEGTPTVFISFDFENTVKHSFLRAIDHLRKKYPGARLSIVPSEYWALLGNYTVHYDVQAEVYHSTHPGPAPPSKAEDTTPTVARSDTTTAQDDLSSAPSSLQPGCFPEAYIVKAQQPPC